LSTKVRQIFSGVSGWLLNCLHAENSPIKQCYSDGNTSRSVQICVLSALRRIVIPFIVINGMLILRFFRLEYLTRFLLRFNCFKAFEQLEQIHRFFPKKLVTHVTHSAAPYNNRTTPTALNQTNA
jgi:hypothetical protein